MARLAFRNSFNEWFEWFVKTKACGTTDEVIAYWFEAMRARLERYEEKERARQATIRRATRPAT
jgi:hypothetical protein